jgi:hypothetical protein
MASRSSLGPKRSRTALLPSVSISTASHPRTPVSPALLSCRFAQRLMGLTDLYPFSVAAAASK